MHNIFKYSILLVFLGITLGAAETKKAPGSWAFTYVNDNFIRLFDKERLVADFSPDDFYTASGLITYCRKDWKWRLAYNMITSRYFELRYDLLRTSVEKNLSLGSLIINPEIGLVIKGNLGGQSVQNIYHRIADFDELDFPYSNSDISLLFEAGIGKKYTLSENDTNVYVTFLEIRMLTGCLPSHIYPKLELVSPFILNRIQLELAGGYRYFINDIKDYSEFVQSGPVFALSLNTKIYRKIVFSTGMSLYPVHNVGHRPDKTQYFSQVWAIISWNMKDNRVLNIIEGIL